MLFYANLNSLTSRIEKISLMVFTARRYASVVYAIVVCLSIRPSVRVCLFVTGRHYTKWLHAGSRKQRHATIA